MFLTAALCEFWSGFLSVQCYFEESGMDNVCLKIIQGDHSWQELGWDKDILLLTSQSIHWASSSWSFIAPCSFSFFKPLKSHDYFRQLSFHNNYKNSKVLIIYKRITFYWWSTMTVSDSPGIVEKRHGLESSLALPLIKRFGQVTSLLFVHLKEKRFWTTDF